MRSKLYLLLFIIPVLSLFVFWSLTFAQTPAQTTAVRPDVLLTWSTSSYVPPDYQGKALPSLLSHIKLAVEVSDSGRLVDLSKMMIRWYVDGNFSTRGVGLQTFSFPAKRYSGNAYNVRVVIPDYGDAGDLAKAVTIPIVDPEPVIRVLSPDNVITQKAFTLEGIPYFFNVADPSSLQYFWTLNGQSASSSQNARILDVNLGDNVPDNTYLRAGLTIQNPASQIETGSKETILLYKKR